MNLQAIVEETRLLTGDSRLSDNPDEAPSSEAAIAIPAAVKAVQKILQLTGDTLPEICQRIETVSTQHDLKSAFGRLNDTMRILLELPISPQDYRFMGEAVCSLGVSERLNACISEHQSLDAALVAYKTRIISALALVLQRKKQQQALLELRDDELFARLLPEPSPPAVPETKVSSPQAPKRTFSQTSQVGDLSRIPKRIKSTIPALAALHLIPGGGGDGRQPKKHVLVTRQKLRAGLDDPKGLLNLHDSSTNALERVKQLELLKSSGWLQNQRSGMSVTDKLNEAILNVDLGLAAHRVRDTLLFGAQVLNCPGFLTNRNISDIENNLIQAKTTWKHQNAYAKMIIAGCLNQAKRILEMFDEVLHDGEKPEILVQKTHSTISQLLESDDCRRFLSNADSTEEAIRTDRDNFIKRIVGAVEPVLPITLRNNSLDAGYLRTALHLLGATELLFAQFETDIRQQANPAGVVGLATAMHGATERSVMFNHNQKSLKDFMDEMRSKYITSLGLGSSFPKDNNRPRQKRWSRRGRQTFSRNRLASQRSVDATQNPHQGGRDASAQTSNIANRGRDVCFAFQAGTCSRGSSCRYRHDSQ